MNGRHADRLFRPAVIAILLTVWGLLLYRILTVPVGLQHDEAFNLLDVISVLNGHHPLYFPANFGREPLFIYSVVFVVKYLSGLHFIWDLRFAGVTWAFLGLSASVPLLARLVGRRTAVLSLGFMGASFWFLFTARVGLRAILLLPFSAGMVYLLTKGVERRTMWFFFLAGVLGGVGVYTYLASRVMFFVPVVFSAYYAWRERRNKPGKILLGMVSALAIMVVVSLPLYFYGRSHQMDRRVGELSYVLNALRHGDILPAVHSSAETMESLLWKGKDLPHYLYNVPHRPVLRWPLAILWILGCIFVLMRPLREENFVLLTMLFVGLLPDLLTTGGPLYLRGMISMPYVFALVGKGGEKLLSMTGSNGKRRRVVTMCAALLLIGVFVWNFLDSTHAYFDSWAKSLETYKLYNGDLRAIAMLPRERMGSRTFVSADFWMDIDQQTYLLYNPRRRDVDWFNASLALPVPKESGATYFFTISSPDAHGIANRTSCASNGWEVRAFYGNGNLAHVCALTDGDFGAILEAFHLRSLQHSVVYGGSMELLAGSARPDGAGNIDVVSLWSIVRGWSKAAPPRISVGIFDGGGSYEWTHSDDLVGFAYQDWQRGDRFLQFTRVPLPADMPPGKYDVRIGIYAVPGRLLPMVSGSGYLGTPPKAAEVVLNESSSIPGEIPKPPVAFDEVDGDVLVPAGLWNRPKRIFAGVPTVLRVSWVSGRKPVRGVEFRAELISKGGDAIWKGKVESNTPEAWPPGRSYRLRQVFTPDLSPGKPVSVTLRLCALSSDGKELGCGFLGGIELISPHRVTRLGSNPEHAVGAVFGDVLELDGYDLQASKGRVKLVLYWKVLAKPTTRLKRFVHVIGADGKMLTQNDALLQHPERLPFFAWMRGEYLVDRTVLEVPASGGYSIEVGVYDPDTGKRLPVVLRDGKRAENDALRLKDHRP